MSYLFYSSRFTRLATTPNTSRQRTVKNNLWSCLGYLPPLRFAVILPAPELCLVKVVGKGALGSVGSGGDRWKNLHNITSHCTRPDVKIREIPKTAGGG